MKRLNACLSEVQTQNLLLTRQLEQAELSAKHSAAEHTANLERQREEHIRSVAAEKRAIEERLAVASRAR